MKIVFLGDIIGSKGIAAIEKFLPVIKYKYPYDFLIVNAENVTQGKGLCENDYYKLISMGIDGITLGNHWFSCPDIINVLNTKSNIIRPYNITHAVGYGITSISKNGRTIVLINLLTTLYMDKKVTNPFLSITEILKYNNLKKNNLQCILIDLHGTSTYEKKAFGYFCDGKVSCIVGTHTHVQTSDNCILPRGTGFHSDVGMCGDKNSCAGSDTYPAIKFFCNDDCFICDDYVKPQVVYSVSGTYLEIDSTSKLAKSIDRILLY